MKEIKGFNNYYWRPYWGIRKYEYEYVSSRFDLSNPPFRITVERVDNFLRFGEPDEFLFKIDGKGKGIKRQLGLKSKMEKDLGKIFAELISYQENLKVLFNSIFENK